jgi:alkylation response protein AidB-like acyl-CoA dehydrogenase
MADYNSMPEAEFRAMVREFVTGIFPPDLLHVARRVGPLEVAHYNRQMADKGWIAPAWPVEYGGMGLDVAHQIAFAEELSAIGVPRLHEMGLVMLGPLLMQFGTEKQKQRYLPKIVSAEHVWCQGYSEPNAGSDLASLRLAAVRDGEEWVLNGQKIWTTMAHQSNMMFMLARTDPSPRIRQEGISFFLVDLTAPGITVRPIRTLSDELEFCEVFFDDVRIPAENRVGDLHKGWTIAKALLGHERLFVGSPRYVKGAIDRLDALAAASGSETPGFSPERYTKLHLDYQDFLALYADYSNFVKQGGELGAEASILKLLSSETYQAVTEEILSITGEAGVAADGGNAEQAEGATMFFQSRPSTIAGGTSQVQRNIIGKAVLNLPSA